MDASRVRVFQCSTYYPGFLFSLPFWLLSIPYFLAWSVMHFKRCFKNILSSIFSCFWWYGQSIFVCYFEGNIIRYGVFGMDDSKNFIFASVFKIFYVIFLSLFVNLLFVCVCVFFSFFFFFFLLFYLILVIFQESVYSFGKGFFSTLWQTSTSLRYVCLTLRK